MALKYKELGAKQDNDNQQHFTIEGVRYLEKIIQLPFQIPPVEQSEVSDFVQKLSTEWPREECPKVFAEGLGDNPRQIKRTVNVFLMLWKLAEKRKDKLQGRIKPIRLAKVVAIQSIYPELYNVIKETPRYLRELEDYYRTELSSVSKDGIEIGVLTGLEAITAVKRVLDGDTDMKSHIEPPPALAPFISRSAVRRILTMHPSEIPEANFGPLTSDDLRLYFTLTRRVEAPQTMPPAEGTRLLFEPQMIKVPAGKFLMGSTDKQLIHSSYAGEEQWLYSEQPQHEVALSDYLIGKYPVTNQEYQEFVKSIKYMPPSHWNGDQYPQDKGDHPIVNVSWDDGVAYCNWLSKQTSKAYHLPTEAQWEKAARGSDGRIWPWGNEYDTSKANTLEAGINATTSVGQFSPMDNSPYGCVDMTGNVWEWCNDWFNKDEYKKRAGKAVKDPQGPQEGNLRVLHGGSCYRSNGDSRGASRRANEPHLVGDAKGFRVASSTFTRLTQASGQEYYGKEFTRE